MAVSWVLIGIVVIDMLSSRQTTIKFDEVSETLYFMLTVVVGWGIASWFLLGYAGRATAALRARSELVRTIHILITIVQFSLLGFLVFILFNRDYENLTW